MCIYIWSSFAIPGILPVPSNSFLGSCSSPNTAGLACRPRDPRTPPPITYSCVLLAFRAGRRNGRAGIISPVDAYLSALMRVPDWARGSCWPNRCSDPTPARALPSFRPGLVRPCFALPRFRSVLAVLSSRFTVAWFKILSLYNLASLSPCFLCQEEEIAGVTRNIINDVCFG